MSVPLQGRELDQVMGEEVKAPRVVVIIIILFNSKFIFQNINKCVKGVSKKLYLVFSDKIPKCIFSSNLDCREKCISNKNYGSQRQVKGSMLNSIILLRISWLV